MLYTRKTLNMGLANYIAYRLALSAIGVQAAFFDVDEAVADYSDAVLSGIVFC